MSERERGGMYTETSRPEGNRQAGRHVHGRLAPERKLYTFKYTGASCPKLNRPAAGGHVERPKVNRHTHRHAYTHIDF